MFVGFAYGQNYKSFQMGRTSLEELKMSSYVKDSTANAVVLEEQGRTYLSEKHNLDFRTDVYRRIKIFDKKAFNLGTISISLYDKQEAKNIEAYSYQLVDGEMKKIKLEKKNIFKKDVNQKWNEVVFTMPNLQEGGIIEYKYSVISPYTSVDDWDFQSDIPKIKSDYVFTYLGNYKYNVRLKGNLRLDRNDSSVKKKCVRVPGVGEGACGVLTYGMDSIPAFKSEQYMLSKENFISHLAFDLISITYTDGRVKKYTKTWEDADRSFKENFLDGQVNKKKYFARSIPEHILAVENPLERTKQVYKYIQDRFTWNKRYWALKKISVRDAYESRNGGVDAINLSLFNSLQAAGIESYIVMIATRNRALPTKLFPVTNDFNYVIVKAVVDGKTYFLDATDKFLSFGQLPIRCLNGEGRVLDFKKGSYWELVKPILDNSTRMFVKLSVNENGEIEGDVNVSKKGYFASDNREEFSKKSEDDYISDLESGMLDYEIEEYKSSNLTDLEKPFSENFTFVSTETIEGQKSIRINPFYYFRVASNPFQLEERNYPVDFAYPRKYTYTLNFTIPDGYEIGELPKNAAVKTPGNGATFVFRTKISGKVLTVNYRYLIRKKVFSSEEYYYLKQFFSDLITLHGSSIELKTM